MSKHPEKSLEPRASSEHPYKRPPRLAPIYWKNVPLKEFKKNFLKESKTCKYSDDAIANYYDKGEATWLPRNTAKVRCPFFKVSETPFPQSMKDQYRSEGFNEPLPLHAISWPFILSGENFAGVTQCKREALIHTYALPALLHVQDRIATAGVATVGGDPGPFALILTNVKKHGQLIVDKLKLYGEPLGIKSHLIAGSHEKEPYTNPVKRGLRDNPHIVVACPGQPLEALVLTRKLNLKRCSFLVLDDGGRWIKNALLLQDILGQIRNDRQIILWTNAFGTVSTHTVMAKALAPFGFTNTDRLFFGSYAHFNNPNAVKYIVMHVTEDTRLDRFGYLIQSILASAADYSSPKRPKFLICCNTPNNVSGILNLLLSIGLQARQFVKPREIANDEAPTETTDDDEDEDENVDDLQLTPREHNDLNMSENPTTHFWITHQSTPLEDTNYGAFDFLLNFDFPMDTQFGQFSRRATKFHVETGGKGTIYQFLLGTEGPGVNKYLINLLQEANQYVLPTLYEEPPKKKTKETTASTSPSQLNVQHPNTKVGPMQRERLVRPGRRPQPYGRDNFDATGIGDTPLSGGPSPKIPVGSIGNEPSSNFRNKSSSHFGGESSAHFKSSRLASNFGDESRNINHPGNRFSGGGYDDDMRDVPKPNDDILGALKLLDQLREKFTGKPATRATLRKTDNPFYRRGESPPPVNNSTHNFERNDKSSNVRSGNKLGGNYDDDFSSSFVSESSSRNQFRDSSKSISTISTNNRDGSWSNSNLNEEDDNRSFNSNRDNGGGNQSRFRNFSNNSNWSNNF